MVELAEPRSSVVNVYVHRLHVTAAAAGRRLLPVETGGTVAEFHAATYITRSLGTARRPSRS